ncbi:MAG: PAS domain-containing protein [Bacteroidetes bacterium]|nr:PAS domain-containing protein [Bacteroidota bacterium]
MRKADKIANEIFAEFESAGVVLQRMNEEDLQTIFDICNTKKYIIWINDYAAMTPLFINDYAVYYYGFDNEDFKRQGFKLYENFMHPDHFNDFHKALTFITNYPKEIYETTFRVKEKGGEWRWTHSTSKALNHDKMGKTILLFSVVFDIADMVEFYYQDDFVHSKEAQFRVINRPLYNALTKREKEILHLIADEKTSNEIGTALKIQASTVDSHRKKMIKKLNCKNSFGLAKYAIYFES